MSVTRPHTHDAVYTDAFVESFARRRRRNTPCFPCPSHEDTFVCDSPPRSHPPPRTHTHAHAHAHALLYHVCAYCVQAGHSLSLLDNLPDLDAEGNETGGEGEEGGSASGGEGTPGAVRDGLEALSRSDLVLMVRQLRADNRDLSVRMTAAEMESAHYRKKLDVAKARVVEVSQKRKGSMSGGGGGGGGGGGSGGGGGGGKPPPPATSELDP